jgi:hypothetical protein
MRIHPAQGASGAANDYPGAINEPSRLNLSGEIRRQSTSVASAFSGHSCATISRSTPDFKRKRIAI